MNGKKILVVDDAEDIRMLVRRLLVKKGYDVICVNNGREALDALESVEVLPDLIILDLMMPIMDGFEFRDQQRSISRFSSIPVIVMTADSNVGKNVKRLDPKRLIPKPFDALVLLAVVAEHVPCAS
ncbi:MAG TPA: response regulator [Oligoflexus sp.]|uniref:response regulator n=1 Tax=Oligoflexus sp. TaxID=1971216 RepID=UPI002D41CBA8|nr:response regulator [Oligoflexus sp.]HYX36118.1 response regulator [Oligoflexus sp.]